MGRLVETKLRELEIKLISKIEILKNEEKKIKKYNFCFWKIKI